MYCAMGVVFSLLVLIAGTPAFILQLAWRQRYTPHLAALRRNFLDLKTHTYVGVTQTGYVLALAIGGTIYWEKRLIIGHRC